MTARAASSLHLHVDGATVVYAPGDEIDPDHVGLISNPAAIVDDGEDGEESVEVTFVGEEYPRQEDDGTVTLGPDVTLRLDEQEDGTKVPVILYMGLEFRQLPVTDGEAPGDADAVVVTETAEGTSGSATSDDDGAVTTESDDDGAGTPAVDADSDADGEAAKAPRARRSRATREG